MQLSMSLYPLIRFYSHKYYRPDSDSTPIYLFRVARAFQSSLHHSFFPLFNFHFPIKVPIEIHARQRIFFSVFDLKILEDLSSMNRLISSDMADVFLISLFYYFWYPAIFFTFTRTYLNLIINATSQPVMMPRLNITINPQYQFP